MVYTLALILPLNHGNNKISVRDSAMSSGVSHRKLSDIDLSDNEFNMKTGEGLGIVNWGAWLEGCGYACVPGRSVK